jgi:site-specific recombinase XerD
MPWLKIESADELFAQLEREAATARPATRSGCLLPEGEDCTLVAWSPALPRLPALKEVKALPTPNQALLKHFRNWLHLSGYGPVGRLVYGHAVRLAFSLLEKDWREIVIETDLDRARAHVRACCADARVAKHILIGLDLFAAYLATRQQRRLLPRGRLAHLPWPATQFPAPAEPDLSDILDESNIQPTAHSGCVPLKAPEGRRRFVKSAGLPPGVLEPVLLIPVRQWPEPNRAFYQHFRNWLHWSGYSPSALYLYGLAVRVAFSLVTQDWRAWQEADLAHVREWVRQHYPSLATRAAYLKGLDKLAQYLRLRQAHRLPPKAEPMRTTPAPPASPRTSCHPPLTPLPEALQQSLDEYRDHCRRNWPRERADELGRDLLRRVGQPLRWLMEHGEPLQQPEDLTPHLWLRYVDARLEQGVKQGTLNGVLGALLGWLRWRGEQGLPVDARMLLMKPFKEAKHLPKDVPLPDLRVLQAAIVAEGDAVEHGARRRGVMDLAWFLLMLHCGLRTGEVRRLRCGDVDWSRKLLRIDQSKGLKDRLVPLSPQTAEALNRYLVLREKEEALTDAEGAPDERVVFIERHAPLSKSYCFARLRTYGARCGVACGPHRLRHSCATLLLNAGMPVPSVQALLGHKWVETTLEYARLYDGTLAADYTRAMLSAERDLRLGDDAPQALTPAQMVALADSLRAAGTLNEQQLDALATLRAGLLGLVSP